MNKDEEFLDNRELCLELLSSIKCLEARIDELISVLKCHKGFMANDRRLGTIAKLERLILSRERLIESLTKVLDKSRKETAGRDIYNPFDKISVKYIDLRSQAQELLKEHEEQ